MRKEDEVLKQTNFGWQCPELKTTRIKGLYRTMYYIATGKNFFYFRISVQLKQNGKLKRLISILVTKPLF